MSAEEIASLHKQNVPDIKSEHLYMYAIVRKDLEMPPGKLSAQSGHAYTDALVNAIQVDPERVMDYRNPEKGGSKVTLKAKNVNQLLKAYEAALEAGLPCALIVDQGHVLPPYFTGEPVITAVGIGPCNKSECSHITKKFNCV